MKTFLLTFLLFFNNNQTTDREVQFVFSKNDCTSDNVLYSLDIGIQTPDNRLVYNAMHGEYETVPGAYIWESKRSSNTQCKDIFHLSSPNTFKIEIKPNSKKNVNPNTKFTVHLYIDVDLIMSVELIPSQPYLIDLQAKTSSLVFTKR